MKERLNEKLALLTGRQMALIVERDGRILFESPESRVVALVLLLRDRGDEMRGATVIDKVVGAAAAKLCAYGEAAEVFAGVASEAGVDALRAASIPMVAREVVPIILDQDRSDMCPMERMSRDFAEPSALFRTLVERIGAA
jgi:hypothetical protein